MEKQLHTGLNRQSKISLLQKLKHYDWSLFFWHLALEKILKGLITKHEKIPPPVHRLDKLALLAEIKLTSEQVDQLKEISSFNLEARYDDYKHKFYKKATKEFALRWIKICGGFYLWLLKKS
ncbi:TPA: DNA-binding protein [Patescibacteria group bacterium]|uniref:HEPN domain protein n=1 Tax=Candidatus Gottesmanbacteria bacterium GW2011_GWA1_43_11 TaxID=1618436 RepID=A0A0G1F7J0_9BACT|nr:MAG: HEPN domain protein [Candidatus Gottesmanbacteria bacterium GW2011_GWA1_43_11]HCS78702.1 DNA-binding protein [Patescibacteria group bacterium]